MLCSDVIEPETIFEHKQMYVYRPCGKHVLQTLTPQFIWD